MTTSLVLVKLKTLRNLFHFPSLLEILLIPKQPNNHKHGDALCSSLNNFKRLATSLSIDLLFQTSTPHKAVSKVGVRKNQKINGYKPPYISLRRTCDNLSISTGFFHIT